MRLTRPDDWHLHLRDGAMLRAVLPCTARHFARALVMPNLVPAITTVDQARAYRDRILAALPDGMDFAPLLTAYLTDGTDPDEIVRGHRAGVFTAVKLYPAHATTNSAAGVTDLKRVWPVLEAMARHRVPLCVHGEVTSPDVDVFDREAVFLERVLGPLVAELPELPVVLEHVTTRESVAFVRRHSQVRATITAHHLWWNRNALFAGGLRPHAYCLPVLKREHDREALVDAATSGDPSFFGGTDSAPHALHRKEADCGCAGIFSAPTAVAAYAQVFDDAGALDRLDAFLGHHGAAFYGVDRNPGHLVLERAEQVPPATLPDDGAGPVRVFLGGERLRFTVGDA